MLEKRNGMGVAERKDMLTAKHANGLPSTTAPTKGGIREEMIQMYGDDVYIEYFDDRGLVWRTEDDAVDDDGQRAVASIYW